MRRPARTLRRARVSAIPPSLPSTLRPLWRSQERANISFITFEVEGRGARELFSGFNLDDVIAILGFNRFEGVFPLGDFKRSRQSSSFFRFHPSRPLRPALSIEFSLAHSLKAILPGSCFTDVMRSRDTIQSNIRNIAPEFSISRIFTARACFSTKMCLTSILAEEKRPISTPWYATTERRGTSRPPPLLSIRRNAASGRNQNGQILYISTPLAFAASTLAFAFASAAAAALPPRGLSFPIP